MQTAYQENSASAGKPLGYEDLTFVMSLCRGVSLYLPPAVVARVRRDRKIRQGLENLRAIERTVLDRLISLSRESQEG